MMEEQRRCVDCGRVVNRWDESIAESVWLRYLVAYERKRLGGHPVPERLRLGVRCPDCVNRILKGIQEVK